MSRPASRSARTFLGLIGMLALVSAARADTILVSDDYNDNSIDPAKWAVVTAGIPQRLRRTSAWSSRAARI